jgi:DNA mismatch endonuclease (patch repair protein)
MTDVHSKKQRSHNMSCIKSRDTKPELIIRKWLWANGFRYRLHYKKLPGKPDIVFPGKAKVILVHGCFWHKHSCKYFKWPQNNTIFWKKKINDNVDRDRKNLIDLKSLGWSILVVWECETKKSNQLKTFEKIHKFLM